MRNDATDRIINARAFDDDAAAEWVPLDELLPWTENPRKNSDNVARVAKSIEQFGFGAPILARRENGEIIAGHTRALAAKMLGLKKVPVRFLELSERDAHLLALADNRLTELAPWDDEGLHDILSEYSLPEVELAGWDQAALEKLAAEFLPSTEDVQGALDQLQQEKVTCPKCGHEFET